MREPKAKRTYSEHREEMAARSRAKAKAGQEIGPIPPRQMVAHIDGVPRREACSLSLVLHANTYHPNVFRLGWSKDLLEAAEIMQDVILHGGLFALALPRGGGKTALARVAVEWATLNGCRRFVMLLGATDPLAGKSMRAIKSRIATNDLLYEDYPEVCFPIRELGNNSLRAKMQTCEGLPTNIKWSDDEIRLPNVRGSLCAGSIIYTRGITGAVRGANEVTPDGGEMRPDFVLPDDVQTRESAKSPQQINDRELVIQGDVLELAGPDTAISGVMLCTEIYNNDLSHRFLDRERHPDWQGKRYKAVYKFPKNQSLWDEYAAIRAESLRAGGRGKHATDFYIANRAAMDEGAEVAWGDRVKEGDISALQTAMNVKISKPKTFAAEWQNEPESASMNLADVKQLAEDDLAKKLNQQDRRIVPRGHSKLTAFVDIHQEVLMYKVCAFTDSFGGAVIDYGAFPEQPVAVFDVGSVPHKLVDRYPRMELAARIIAGLNELVPQLLGRKYMHEGNEQGSTISLCLIDAGFNADAVHDFISRCPLKALLKASMGKGITADRKPFSEYRKGPGDQMGWCWRIDARPQGKGTFVAIDVNSWKTAMVNSFLAPPGSAMSMHVFGSKIWDHPLWVQHMLAEYRTPTFGQGRRVEVWKMRPGETENHFFDGLIGCSVAASILGLQWSSAAAAGMPTPEPDTKPKVNHQDEYQRQRKAFEARRGGMR